LAGIGYSSRMVSTTGWPVSATPAAW
jgi:hypothetical protein